MPIITATAVAKVDGRLSVEGTCTCGARFCVPLRVASLYFVCTSCGTSVEVDPLSASIAFHERGAKTP